MPDPQEIKRSGYERVYGSEKFEVWVSRKNRRVYVSLMYPLTESDLNEVVRQTDDLNLPHVDLITDHTRMPPINQEQEEDVFVCLDKLFSRLRIRNVVRVCSADESCRVCIPLDTRMSTEEKGRLLGRVRTFAGAEKLLDAQQGKS